MSALFQLGEILKYWESPNQIYNTTIRIWHRFGLPQKYRYIYIIAWTGGLKSQNHTWIQLLKVMWQGEDSKLTVCTLKKQALWSPISMPFAMKGYQSSNNKNTHITWGYGLFNGDETKKTWCLKRSVQVSTTVKKKIYFTKHSTPIQLENQNCIEKIVVEFFYLMICDYSNLPHLYSDISGVIFLTITTKSTKHPTKTGSVRWCPSLSTTRCLASNELVTSSGRPTGSGCGRRWQEGGCFTMDWMPKLTIKLHGGEGFRCTDAKARCLNDVSTQWIVHEYKSYE